MTLGIDIGTTSVSGVAVDGAGDVVATITLAHAADIPGLPPGVHAQDPARLMSAVDRVIDELEAKTGAADRIGWTGQMHGVIGVDRDLVPATPFVTWRDARRFGGRVMAEWSAEGRNIDTCLPICGLAIARRTGRRVIDPTFLHSWHLEDVAEDIPSNWLPDVDESCMLGDNQAGVYAAQHLYPGCAVINLGTSGQLSVVEDVPFSPWRENALERRPYPGGKTLLCRISLVGGRAFADLRDELRLGWDEMNARAETDARIADCINRIIDDLVGGIAMTGISSLVGVGNALTRNPAIRHAAERRFGVPCVIPPIAEMAAYGAAIHANSCRTAIV